MVNEHAGLSVAPRGESRDLLIRVAGSPQFLKSKRLRELLLFLGESALDDPARVLREQDIGVEMLGRSPAYDTSHDTLVRVQVSQLRKKLQEYFLGEGAAEPFVIEIPKGSYTVLFKPRTEAAEPVHPATVPEAAGAKPTALLGRRNVMAAAAGMLVAGIVGLVVGLSLHALPRRVSGSSRPTVDRFWTQLFQNGQPTYLVLSDIGLIEFQNRMQRWVSLAEYETREFDKLADRYYPDPAARELARGSVHRVSTSMSDVQAAVDFSILARENRVPLKLISARDLSSGIVSSQNVILLGSWRANPWVGLFEDKLNFRTDYQELPPQMRFRNTAPLKGEQPYYQALWRQLGYCRVSYLANPSQTGSILLISGSDVISSESGGRLLTSEEAMRQLRSGLELKAGERFPHFELLLKTQITNNTVMSYEVVSCRRSL